MRQAKMILPYGQEVALATKRRGAMPELFEHFADDDELTSLLKSLAEAMVRAKPAERLTVEHVRDQLKVLQNEGKLTKQ